MGSAVCYQVTTWESEVITLDYQQPTVGRIVHYVNAGGDHLAAIITRVSEEVSTVHLSVFIVDGEDYKVTAEYQAEGNEQGTWHWPERS